MAKHFTKMFSSVCVKSRSVNDCRVHFMVITPDKDVQQLQINEVKEDSYEHNE